MPLLILIRYVRRYYEGERWHIKLETMLVYYSHNTVCFRLIHLFSWRFSSYAKQKSGSARDILPENTKVVENTHDLSESERLCPECSEVMQPIRKGVREKIWIIPAQAILYRDVYITYNQQKKRSVCFCESRHTCWRGSEFHSGKET